MKIDGAIVKEQGVTFSIIVVKPHVLQDRSEQDKMRQSLKHIFPSPIILMSQDHRGVPTYQGRKDIVKFLSGIHPSRIPWKTYTIE